MRRLHLTYFAAVTVGLAFAFSGLAVHAQMSLKTSTLSTVRRDLALLLNSGQAGWASIARPRFSSAGRKMNESDEITGASTPDDGELYEYPRPASRVLFQAGRLSKVPSIALTRPTSVKGIRARVLVRGS